MAYKVIKVTIEKAKEWFSSGNPALVEMALDCYSSEELIGVDYPSICEELETDTCCIDILPHDKRVQVIAQLRILSYYYTKQANLRKEDMRNFYIIRDREDGTINVSEIRTDFNIGGAISFTTEEAAQQALNIIGDDIKYLFLPINRQNGKQEI